MKTIISRLGSLGLGLALVFVCSSSPAEATSVTIQNVTVTSTVGADTRTWCMIGCVFNSGAGNLWASFANTVINSPSTGGNQSLVLTQNPTANVPGFNFDTSEHIFSDGSADSCGRVGGTALSCLMTLNILTNLFGLVSVPLPLNNALNNFNADPSGGTHKKRRTGTYRSSTSRVDSMCGSATRITPTRVSAPIRQGQSRRTVSRTIHGKARPTRSSPDRR